MKDTPDVAWTSRKIRTETCRLKIAGLLEKVPWERLPWGGGNRNQAVTGRVSSVRSGDVETGKATLCEGFGWREADCRRAGLRRAGRGTLRGEAQLSGGREGRAEHLQILCWSFFFFSGNAGFSLTW